MATKKVDSAAHFPLVGMQAPLSDLGKVTQRMDALKEALDKQAASIAKSFGTVTASTNTLQRTLYDLDDAIILSMGCLQGLLSFLESDLGGLKDGISRLESGLGGVVKKLDSQPGPVAQTALGVGTGITSAMIYEGIIKKVLPWTKSLDPEGSAPKGDSYLGKLLQSIKQLLQSLQNKISARKGAGFDFGDGPYPKGKGDKGGNANKRNKNNKRNKGGLGKGPKLLITATAAGATAGLMGLATNASAATGAMDSLTAAMGDGMGSIATLDGAFSTLLELVLGVGPVMAMAGTAVSGVGSVLRAVGAIAMANPILTIIGAIAAAATLIITNWDSVSAFFQSAGETITAALAKVKTFLVGLIPDWLKDLLGIDGGKGIEATVSEAKESLGKAISEALPSMDDMLDGLKGAGEAVKNFGGGLLDSASGFIGSLFGGSAGAAAAASVNPGMAATHIDNSVESVAHMGGVTINVKSTDPAQAARDINYELGRLVANANKGVF